MDLLNEPYSPVHLLFLYSCFALLYVVIWLFNSRHFNFADSFFYFV